MIFLKRIAPGKYYDIFDPDRTINAMEHFFRKSVDTNIYIINSDTNPFMPLIKSRNDLQRDLEISGNNIKCHRCGTYNFLDKEYCKSCKTEMPYYPVTKEMYTSFEKSENSQAAFVDETIASIRMNQSAKRLGKSIVDKKSEITSVPFEEILLASLSDYVQ